MNSTIYLSFTKQCLSLIASLLLSSSLLGQTSKIEYDANNFHDTILALYEMEIQKQEKKYIEFLRQKLDNSILDMNDYYGYSISKWEEINRNKEEEKRNEMQIFLIVTGVMTLFFYLYHLKLKRNDKAWNDGLIPKNFEFSEDNLMEAYLRLAGMMMRYDLQNQKEKITYAHRYFAKHFPDISIDFSLILREAYKKPIKLDVAAKWLKVHLPKHERIQVLYFLAGLAVIDGDLNSSEKAIIIKFSELLDLSKKDLESILSMYTRYEWRDRQREQQSRPTISRRSSELERCSKVLGVSSQAKMDEIKKAYRGLVKLHHPDRFATASKAQQKIAEERFIKIQKAYEYLESRK